MAKNRCVKNTYIAFALYILQTDLIVEPSAFLLRPFIEFAEAGPVAQAIMIHIFISAFSVL